MIKNILKSNKTDFSMEQKFEEQLLQNYEFYKSAFELSKDPKLVLEDCTIVRFNPVTMSMFESDNPHDIFKHKFDEFLSNELTYRHLKEQCEGNLVMETELRTCAGNWIPVSINFDNISRNGVQRTIVTIHDITEIKKGKKELEESNEFIYTVMQNLPFGLGVKSIDHKFVKYMNPKFSETMGWPEDIVKDFDLYFEKSFPDPGEAKRIKELVLNTLEKNKFAHWDIVKIKDSEGNDRYLDFTMFLLEDQNSSVTMVKNVTQEVKDKAWLKVESEAVKALPNGVVITDFEGKILWVNPAFSTTYGYDLNEVKGQTPRILKSGEHDEAFYKNLWDTIKSGKVWRGRVVNKCKDNTELIDNQIIAPVRAGGAEITHFVAIKNLTPEELDYKAK